MAGRWKKEGARPMGAREVRLKLDGKLKAWDLLPIGEKIGKMEALLSALGNPQERRGKFGFLAFAPPEELARNGEYLRGRLLAEKGSLERMKEAFSRWGIDLGKINLSAEDISHPNKTRWYEHPGHVLYYFYSPGMARWYERVVEKRDLQPSYWQPLPDIRDVIGRRKAFGLGRMYREGKGTATIGLVQPLVFYKKEPLAGEARGKMGTPHRVPLANPDLLMLYAQLKEAKEQNAKVVNVKEEFRDVYGAKDKPPFLKIYDRIAELSHPFKKTEQASLEYKPGEKRVPRESKERKVLRAVFKSSR